MASRPLSRPGAAVAPLGVAPMVRPYVVTHAQWVALGPQKRASYEKEVRRIMTSRPRGKNTLMSDFFQPLQNLTNLYLSKGTFKFSPSKIALFNGTAVCDIIDPVDLFNNIVTGKITGIQTASLKGGRFRELGRINSKGVIPYKGSSVVPNQLMIQFQIEGRNNIANIFNNGIIRMSGASKPEEVVQFLSKFVSGIEEVVVSNTSGQFSIDQSINLAKLMEKFPKSLLTKNTLLTRGRGTVIYKTLHEEEVEDVRERSQNYTRERYPPQEAVSRVILGKLRKPPTRTITSITFAITFYSSGVVQYKGKFINEEIIKNYVTEILNGVPDALTPKGGFFERTKIQKAIQTFKTKSLNPPNPPDSFEGTCKPGYYCRPNAQGFPTCYKIPAINESSKRTVIEAYKRAGVAIPASVRSIFGITSEDTVNYGVKLTLETQQFRGKSVQVLKVGGRQCYRLSEDQLESVARRLGIPGIRKGMGIATMCARLKEAAQPSVVDSRANFVIDGQKYYIIGNSIKGAQRRNGKPNPSRKCATIPVETLHKYARAMGIDPSGKSKPKICEEMMKVRATRPLVVSEPEKQSAPQPQVENRRIVEARKRFGNLPYTNEQLKTYMSLNTPAKRAAFMVRFRKNQNLEKRIRNRQVDPQFAKNFRNSVLQFTRIKKRGRLPTPANINAYMNRLIESYKTVTTRPSPRGGAKAPVEVM